MFKVINRLKQLITAVNVIFRKVEKDKSNHRLFNCLQGGFKNETLWESVPFLGSF